MNRVYVKQAVLIFFITGWLGSASMFAASSSPSLIKAKKEAEAKGFVFETSHDDIVAKAKKEGSVKVLMSLSPDNFKPTIEAFRKKYPFINIEIREITGSDAFQTFLLGLEAGTVKDWDVGDAATDFYSDFPPHAMKFDILGMAKEQVLAIDPRMVDPDHRTLVSIASTAACVAYNKNLIAPEKVPDKWEDFLKPEFKGKKFVVNIRPNNMASVLAGTGEEWGLNYARKVKEQDPVWGLGETRILSAVARGENALYQIANYHSCVRAAQKDPTKALVCKVIEPVPVRLHEMEFVINRAQHPYAALLFLEHQVSPEGQRIIDQFEPLKSSLYADGEIAKLVGGRKVWLNDFRSFQNTQRQLEKIVEAYGFPRAKIK